MGRWSVRVVGRSAVVALALVGLLAGAVPSRAADEPLLLDFARFFTPSRQALSPSPELLAASGRVVRIEGYMAELEEPLAGAFWLTPVPVRCDESGAGTGDLPAASVLVLVPGQDREIPLARGRLAVEGRLEVRPEGIGPAARTALAAQAGPAPLRLVLTAVRAVPFAPAVAQPGVGEGR